MLPALTLLRSGSKGLFSAGQERQAPLMMAPMFTQLAGFVKGDRRCFESISRHKI